MVDGAQVVIESRGAGIMQLLFDAAAHVLGGRQRAADLPPGVLVAELRDGKSARVLAHVVAPAGAVVGAVVVERAQQARLEAQHQVLEVTHHALEAVAVGLCMLAVGVALERGHWGAAVGRVVLRAAAATRLRVVLV